MNAVKKIALIVFASSVFLNGCEKPSKEITSTKREKPLNDTGTSYCRDGNSEDFGITTMTTRKPATNYPSHSKENSTAKIQAIAKTSNNTAPKTPSKPKTGNEKCDDSYPQQDGHLGRDALAREGQLKKIGGGYAGFDWTKLGRNGDSLATQSQPWNGNGNENNGQQWSCVRDNHTGLVWEVKSDDKTHFNFNDLKYSWYNTNELENAGAPGLQNMDDCNGIACNTQAYIDALNAKNLCGSNQWRLPTVNELLTLAISDFIDLAMDNDYFPNAKNDQYWSSQTYVPRRELSWYFYFSDGSTASALKTTPVYLRLVHNDMNL